MTNFNPHFLANKTMPLVIGLCLSLFTTTAAATKLLGVVPPLQSSVTELTESVEGVTTESSPVSETNLNQDVAESTTTPNIIVPSPQISKLVTQSTNLNTQVSTTPFDETSLALHNKANDCYVAYETVVYDVSAHPEWGNCFHNGITGGVDITGKFPHSLSYLASLPKVGTYTGSVTGRNRPEREDHDEDEREDEYDESHESDEVKKDDDFGRLN